MELPVFKGTYSNTCDVLDIGFFRDVLHVMEEHKKEYHPYFVGLCYCCKRLGTREYPLFRCGGCQLVAYCSRDCQKKDRSTHKYVCKEFPVVKGMNALYTTGPWDKHIASLQKRAAVLPKTEVAGKPIFRNPRVCRTCREARPERLKDCDCACVSYCSRKCEKKDKQHKLDCEPLIHIALSNYMCDEPDVSVMKDTVYDNSMPLYRWSEVIKGPSELKKDIPNNLKMGRTCYMANERLSYPMSLLHALQTLPELTLAHDNLPLKDLNTLTIHVVTRSPIFDSKPWEIFMHRIPMLKQLNVVFIIQGKGLKESFILNNTMDLLRCKDCKDKDQVITYSVKQMQYHMFFSLEEYSEPDVVVIYGNTQEMSTSDKDDIHSEISYCNMTYSRDTVLVLMDETEDLVTKGAIAVNAARPVDQLVSPRINPFRGLSSNRADLDSDNAIINEKQYFTCLRRK